MKTNDEILEEITCCTIEEDADLDVKENFYYKYEDVITAMNEARKQANGVSTGLGQSNIPDVIKSVCEKHQWHFFRIEQIRQCQVCGKMENY